MCNIRLSAKPSPSYMGKAGQGGAGVFGLLPTFKLVPLDFPSAWRFPKKDTLVPRVAPPLLNFSFG